MQTQVSSRGEFIRPYCFQEACLIAPTTLLDPIGLDSCIYRVRTKAKVSGIERVVWFQILMVLANSVADLLLIDSTSLTEKVS